MIMLSHTRRDTIIRDCSSSDIEKLDSCLLGMRLSEAIRRLKIDTSQISTFEEPILTLRGIDISQSDTCKMRLYVERTSMKKEFDSLLQNWERAYVFIMTKKIIGVSWRKDKQNKKRSIGYRIQYWHDYD